MYGSDSSQAVALAATGSVVGVGWYFIGAGVLLMAGLTLVTIASVIRHRVKEARND